MATKCDLNIAVLSHNAIYCSGTPCFQVKCVEVFKEYYRSDKQHRKLTWIFSLGNCVVIGNFDAKPVEFVLNTYQVILKSLYKVNRSHT